MIDEIVSASGIFCFAKDLKHKYIFCNEKFSELLGLESPHQIKNKTDFDLFPELYANIYRGRDTIVIKGGILRNYRQEILCTPTLLIDAIMSKNLYRDKEGNVTGVSATGIHVSNVNSQRVQHNNFSYDPKSRRYYFPYHDNEWLTEKEYGVLNCLLDGLITSKQIAIKMEISSRTVEDYIARLRKKLQCSSKYQIVQQAMLLGLVS